MKKNYVLSVVAVLLVVGIGFTFAYFVSGVALSGNGSSVSGDTADLIEVEYDALDSALTLNDAIPGSSASKDFTVTVRPTEMEKEVTYGIFIDIDSNTFVKCDDTNYDSITNACTKDAQELTYKITNKEGDVLAEGDLTGQSGKIKVLTETKNVDVETAYDYTITLTFVETNADQNHNENKEFISNVKVEFTELTAKDVILANYPTQLTRSSFSSTVTNTTTGTIYYADTKDGRTYYFAGNPTDNWVKFAGFYWRIIRINEDGSIRMIYAGTDPEVTTGADTQIQTSTFSINSSTYNDNAYVGYMYGTPGSNTYEDTHANINNSGIKKVLDEWYVDNLQADYENYLSTEAGFCGDRTSTTRSSGAPNDTGGTGTTTTYYGARYRLNTNKQPTFECPDEDHDLYTEESASRGNKALDYPIGLITADEVAYAGGVYNTNNNSYYLYTNSSYWTMSPRYFGGSWASVFGVNSNGNFGLGSVNNTYGVRPVINLKADVSITGGNGSSSTPFAIAA